MFFYSEQGAEVAHRQLWIPYAGIAGGVLLLAVVFLLARLPEIKPPDEYHLSDNTSGVSKSIWSHPHFVFALVAQFFYVAAQAGIFAFFINYVVAEIPPVGEAWKNSFWLGGSAGVSERAGEWFVSEQGATKLLAYFGFSLFLLGRASGSWILTRFPPHWVMGVYALAFNIDLERYGVVLPVMPENWKHYIGVNMENVDETIKRLRADEGCLERVAAAGREWAMENYSPKKAATRILHAVELG